MNEEINQPDFKAIALQRRETLKQILREKVKVMKDLLASIEIENAFTPENKAKLEQLKSEVDEFIAKVKEAQKEVDLF